MLCSSVVLAVARGGPGTAHATALEGQAVGLGGIHVALTDSADMHDSQAMWLQWPPPRFHKMHQMTWGPKQKPVQGQSYLPEFPQGQCLVELWWGAALDTPEFKGTSVQKRFGKAAGIKLQAVTSG